MVNTVIVRNNLDNQRSLEEGRVLENENVRGGLSANEEVFHVFFFCFGIWRERTADVFTLLKWP